MVSSADLSRIAEEADRLAPDAVILEFGPWLGAISVTLAGRGDLHVVDSFEGTAAHQRKAPEQCKDGQSFRPVFERHLAERGLSATIHEIEFERFRWDGGPISLVIIDGPKKPADLSPCLQAVLPFLAPDARVLIKNALSPLMTDMAEYLSTLIDSAVLAPTDAEVAQDNNVLTLVVPSKKRASAETDALDGHLPGVKLAEDHPFRLAPLVAATRTGDTGLAYDRLSRMPENRRLIRAWTKLAPSLTKTEKDETRLSALATFGDVLEIHHSGATSTRVEPFHMSVPRVYRGYWINARETPNRGRNFAPDIFARCHEFGYLKWPSRVGAHIQGRSVLDIGCGPGLHGLGYLAAGARQYTGLDPIIKLDRDRVKNLASGGKEAFGWTPAEISARVPDWRVSPQSVQEFQSDVQFDIATLHNVTEHIHGLESAFIRIAELLAPDGRLMFNHHNFYCWNGHHCPPKRVQGIDLSDPEQTKLLDWGHVAFDPPEGHYIARGLNRIRLSEIEELTRRYFEIEVLEDRMSTEDMGASRLTDSIRKAHPTLSDRDFLTQNLFCVARVKSPRSRQRAAKSRSSMP